MTTLDRKKELQTIIDDLNKLAVTSLNVEEDFEHYLAISPDIIDQSLFLLKE